MSSADRTLTSERAGRALPGPELSATSRPWRRRRRRRDGAHYPRCMPAGLPTANAWRRRRAAGVCLLLGAIVLAACSTTTNSTSPTVAPSTTTTPTAGAPSSTSPANPASRLLAATLANARSQNSLHYVSISSEKQETVTITGDVTKTSGWQTIDFATGKSTYVSEVRLLDKECYIRGDAGSLRDFFGLTDADATRYAGAWISVVPSDSYYSSAAAALTVASVIEEMELGEPVTTGAAIVVGGHAYASLHGALAGPDYVGTKGRAVLAVTAGTSSLPVTWASTVNGSTDTMALSRWGEHVSVSAPAASIPLSVITGTPTATTGPPTVV